MSAYDDGYYSGHDSPPAALNDWERTQWLNGRQAKVNEAPLPSYGSDLDGPSFLFLILLVLLCVGLAMFLKKVEHFMEYSYPNPKLPLTVISCTLVVCFLFKKSRISSIGLAVVSLIFIEHWVGVLRRRGFDVAIYDLLGVTLFVILGVGLFIWLKAKMKGK